MACDYIVCIC